MLFIRYLANFFSNLAVKGISDALKIKIKESNERTRAGKDLYSLRVDLHVYLSAWLVCSLDNDNDILMPLEPIRMSYKDRHFPDKKVYKDTIFAIGNTILNEGYKRFRYYPSSDPLESIEARRIIVNRFESD